MTRKLVKCSVSASDAAAYSVFSYSGSGTKSLVFASPFPLLFTARCVGGALDCGFCACVRETGSMCFVGRLFSFFSSLVLRSACIFSSPSFLKLDALCRSTSFFSANRQMWQRPSVVAFLSSIYYNTLAAKRAGLEGHEQCVHVP